MLPVPLLGYTGHLTAPLLAICSGLLFRAAFLASALGRGVRRHLGDTLHHGLAILSLVPDGLRQALRARSVVLVGLVWAAGVIGLSAWLMYLAPSGSWDGLFYHEPMVGLAIQNHGFSVVSLSPIEAVQAVNGYPRRCESVGLWFVIFTDKTFIEIGNTLAAPALMWAFYAIARRFGDRVIAMGWAAVTLLMPAMWTQLATSMIDVEVAFFLLSALYFCTRPRYRARDAVCATLAMLLVTGSKRTALVWVPPLAVATGSSSRIRCGPSRTISRSSAFTGPACRRWPAWLPIPLRDPGVGQIRDTHWRRGRRHPSGSWIRCPLGDRPARRAGSGFRAPRFDPGACDGTSRTGRGAARPQLSSPGRASILSKPLDCPIQRAYRHGVDVRRELVGWAKTLATVGRRGSRKSWPSRACCGTSDSPIASNTSSLPGLTSSSDSSPNSSRSGARSAVRARPEGARLPASGLVARW